MAWSDTCTYCGAPLVIPAQFQGRCHDCFWKVGLNSAPPPEDVVANTDKVPCQRCGVPILPKTAWRTLGYCMSCLNQVEVPLPADPLVAREKFTRVIQPDATTQPTDFLKRYDNGERHAVWAEMQALGGEIGKGAVWDDVCHTVRRTMERVRSNIEVIVERLYTLGYQFSDPDQTHQPPTDSTRQLLGELEQEFGSFPLSLKMFYEIVGSVNLCQSMRQLRMGVTDPIERFKISPLLLMGEETPMYIAELSLLKQLAREGAHFTPDGRRYLWIAPDECRRAHYSNGDDCHLLVPEPGVDFRWIEMRERTVQDEDWLWFIDVLRQSFAGGGFLGRSNPHDNRRRTPPENDITRKLREGLLEV